MASKKQTATEKIQLIPLDELHPYPNHPIKMREDESFSETLESIRQRGVLTPIIVRPCETGYEIIAGRRRKRACEIAGIEKIPAIIRELDDDNAIIDLIDSNIQREYLLPSERAASYKMRLEAIKRQGKKREDTSRQIDGKPVEAADIIGGECGESGRQIQRYVRLNELIQPLMDMVDENKIAFSPAYELSFLSKEEQEHLVETIDYEQATPSLSQAQRMKQQSQAGTLTEDSILEIMCEQKKPAWDRVTLGGEKLRKYFPKSYTPKQIEDTIYRLLDMWYKRRMDHAEKKTTNN